MTVYVAEEFTPDEADILRRYFTNLDGPVFALVNLPEVVKGALFARYSRSPKSLRRLFLDEFVGELDITGDAAIDATVGLRRAEELYDRVFFEYGDDSVAQLGGVHLACEQASNLLTKVLEWGRLMSYLEQSTRYIAYDARLGGRYRYHRDPERARARRSAPATSATWTGCSTPTPSCSPPLQDFFREQFPKEPGDSDFVYRQAIRAKAFDAAAGHPAGGVAVERRHLRHRPGLRAAAAAHAGPPAARGPRLRRPDAAPSCARSSRRSSSGSTCADRGVRLERLPRRRPARPWTTWPSGCFPPTTPPPSRRRRSTLVDFDPDAEVKLVAAMLYPYTHLPERQVERPGAGDERSRSAWRWCGPTSASAATAATSRAGRSSASTTASTCWPTTAPSATSSATACSPSSGSRSAPRHGYTRPEAVDLAGGHRGVRRGHGALGRAARRCSSSGFPAQAPYAVCLAYRVRFVMQMNAREAMHLHRAAHAARRATPPTARSPRRCTASSPRRPATGPWPR